jgi:hypothetical protein
MCVCADVWAATYHSCCSRVQRPHGENPRPATPFTTPAASRPRRGLTKGKALTYFAEQQNGVSGPLFSYCCVSNRRTEGRYFLNLWHFSSLDRFSFLGAKPASSCNLLNRTQGTPVRVAIACICDSSSSSLRFLFEIFLLSFDSLVHFATTPFIWSLEESPP